VKSYRIENKPIVDSDVEAAFEWYEGEEPGLGYEFLDEVRAAYLRIQDGPLKYHVLGSGVRRAFTRRFPYAVYFSIEGDAVIMLAVLHAARNPAEWQRRIE
jgi:plasmid stabilization system protein ParE